MLNKRKSPRRKMVLPVKISVGKVTHLAHTVDITTTGAWNQNNSWGVNLSDEGEAKKDMQTLLTLLSGRSKSVM